METTGPSVTKKCKICGKVKDISRFYKNAAWRRPECTNCFNEIQNQYSKLRKNYTTPELGTPCECCGKTDEILQWDHCHETQSHRGWLCYSCNTGIGKLGDNLEGVTNAMNYLLRTCKIYPAINGDDDFKEEEEEGPTTKGQPD